MKKVLVTGGAGFVGSNLVNQIHNDGHHGICMDDFSTGSEKISPHSPDLPRCAMVVVTQAESARQVTDELIHHSDRDSQYLSIKYSERLSVAGIDPSVGSKGDSYDNALAETINGLFKAEVIYRKGPWRSRESVEYAVLEWVDWFNNRRLLEPIGHVPPAEYEMKYYQRKDKPVMVAGLN